MAEHCCDLADYSSQTVETPMSDTPTTTAHSVESELARAVDEFMDENRQGNRPAIDEFVSRYPALSEDLRRILPAFALLETSKPEVCEPTSSLIGELGDFRIIREVGRGGMGVVYEADQIS